jgi:hypothetical protein
MNIFSDREAMPGLLVFMQAKSLGRWVDLMMASAMACSRAPLPIIRILGMEVLLSCDFSPGEAFWRGVSLQYRKKEFPSNKNSLSQNKDVRQKAAGNCRDTRKRQTAIRRPARRQHAVWKTCLIL